MQIDLVTLIHFSVNLKPLLAVLISLSMKVVGFEDPRDSTLIANEKGYNYIVSTCYELLLVLRRIFFGVGSAR